jgi:hypothetical protein
MASAALAHKTGPHVQETFLKINVSIGNLRLQRAAYRDEEIAAANNFKLIWTQNA